MDKPRGSGPGGFLRRRTRLHHPPTQHGKQYSMPQPWENPTATRHPGISPELRREPPAKGEQGTLQKRKRKSRTNDERRDNRRSGHHKAHGRQSSRRPEGPGSQHLWASRNLTHRSDRGTNRHSGSGSQPNKSPDHGLPPCPRSSQRKEELADAFNQRTEDLELNHDIDVREVTTVASYPTEVLLTVGHRVGLGGGELVAAMTKLQRMIIPGNTANRLPQVSLSRDTMELVIPNVDFEGRARAQEVVDNVCRKLGLKTTAGPAKWLTKHHNREGYQNRNTSTRISVQTESLKALNQAIPIQVPQSAAKILIYRRQDDKAYYVDEAGFTVTNARPSASPEPIKQWTFCTYPNKANHEETECYTKKYGQKRQTRDTQRRETARSNV